jgi:hypothetical protein
MQSMQPINLTVYQLKWLINEYNITKDKSKPEIIKYKSKRKASGIKIAQNLEVLDLNDDDIDLKLPEKY